MTPVTKAAAGEDRKITEPARSAGLPQRFIGVRLRIASDQGGVVLKCLGQRRRDPARRYGVDPDALGGPSNGEALGELSDTAFAGAIGGGEARAPKLSIEATLTMLPPVEPSSGRQAEQTRMVPVRLTSTTWAKVSRSYSAPRRMIPAALSRISRRSSPPTRRWNCVAVGHIEVGGRGCRGWGRRLPQQGGQTGGGNVAARLSQRRRDGGANAAGAAGNQRVAARYVEHGVDPL